MPQDQQYAEIPFQLSERPHHYGDQAHLISFPALLGMVNQLCVPECIQPRFNLLLSECYRDLAKLTASAFFPQYHAHLVTRMGEKHKEAVFEGKSLDPQTSVIIVDLARAGMIPSNTLFEYFAMLLNPNHIRVDHIFINRTTDVEQKVTGADIHGTKIGGPLDDSYVLIPDPMGATGNSMSNVIKLYKKSIPGKALKYVALHLIVTPEYIRRMKEDHPDVEIFTVRLDRGFSSKKALGATPGKYWDEESGLNEQQYIVPGGGGFGELTSNSFV